MKLEQLFQFISVVQNGSINKASIDLYISQSSLSRSIKMLENELGAPLLIRTSQGITLTRYGSEVYDLANMICSNYQKLSSLHVPSTDETKHKMRISSHTLTFVEYAFVQVCKKYEKENPQFSLVEAPVAQAIYDVKNGISDIGVSMCTSTAVELTTKLIKNSDLAYTPVCRANVEVMVGVNHPLRKRGRKSVSINELLKYSFATAEGNFEMSELFALFHNHWPERKPIYVTDKRTLITLLYETNAYSLIPSAKNCKIPLNRFPSEEIATLPLSDPTKFFEIGWFKRKGQDLPPCCEDLVGILKRMF